MKQSHSIDLSAKQKEIDRISFWFPDIPLMAQTADYCRGIGFSHDQTKLLILNRPVEFSGKLTSPKTGRSYEADYVTSPNREAIRKPGFVLTINGIPITQWFKHKYDDIMAKRNIGRDKDQKTGPKIH